MFADIRYAVRTAIIGKAIGIYGVFEMALELDEESSTKAVWTLWKKSG